MLFTYERDLSWIENFVDNIIEGFFRLDVVFQYGLLAVIIYVLVLGSIEFIKKVLIYIPRKIIGVIVFLVVLYLAIVYFKT